jgi:hypothetical protein
LRHRGVLCCEQTMPDAYPLCFGLFF